MLPRSTARRHALGTAVAHTPAGTPRCRPQPIERGAQCLEAPGAIVAPTQLGRPVRPGCNDRGCATEMGLASRLDGRTGLRSPAHPRHRPSAARPAARQHLRHSRAQPCDLRSAVEPAETQGGRRRRHRLTHAGRIAIDYCYRLSCAPTPRQVWETGGFFGSIFEGQLALVR
jgi:hypothetical protein